MPANIIPVFRPDEHSVFALPLDELDEVARNVDAESAVSYVELVKLANATANTMKQLIAALRLPDAAGVRPQYRGPRGAQAPSVPGGKEGTVSSIERARARKKA